MDPTPNKLSDGGPAQAPPSEAVTKPTGPPGSRKARRGGNVTLSPILMSISGPVGDVVFSSKDGQTCVRPRLNSPRQSPPDPAAISRQNRIRVAAQYGKEAIADPRTLRIYEAAGAKTGTPAFALAVSCYLEPPTIEAIGTSCYQGRRGQAIEIGVTNPVGLARVRVVIRSVRGRTLEQGWIKPDAAGQRSHYFARKTLRAGQIVQIQATATNLAGKSGTKVVSYELKSQRPRRAWFPEI